MIERDNIRDLIRSGEAMEYSSEQFSDLIDRIQAAGFAYWESLCLVQYCHQQSRFNDFIINQKVEAILK
jgi:hypothetical protein